MAAKQIAFDTDARERILRGVQNSPARQSDPRPLRPRRRSREVLRRPPPSPRTASPSPRRSSSDDPYENMGAQMVKEVASKSSKDAGDGTTTATIYAEAIFQEGLKNITAGANANQVKKGIDSAVAAIVEELKAMSKPVSSSKEIAQVGTCSANQGRRHRQDHLRGHGQGRQGRRHHRRRRQVPSRPRSSSLKACSSTRATSPRTS